MLKRSLAVEEAEKTKIVQQSGKNTVKRDDLTVTSPTMFTYDGLAEMLRRLMVLPDIFPLGAWANQPGIILRHDVDLDIAPAYRLAEVEKSVGLRSSFFFLVTAETYNPASLRNRTMIRQMSEEGFEIGLHFDPTVYRATDHQGMERAAVREATVLEDIVGEPVRSISLHNPSIHGQYPLFEGWLNAYDPKIFSDTRYLSDSRMVFLSDPLTFFRSAADETFQLLLHPMHYSDEGSVYPMAMLDFLRRKAGYIDETFTMNSTYRRHVGHAFFDHLRDAAAAWARQRDRKGA